MWKVYFSDFTGGIHTDVRILPVDFTGGILCEAFVDLRWQVCRHATFGKSRSGQSQAPQRPEVRTLACPHAPRTHAPRPHTQTGPPVSATRPSLVLFSRALCPRMCAIATTPPPAPPSLSPSSWLTTSSSPAFTSVRWSDSSTQAAASSIP